MVYLNLTFSNCILSLAILNFGIFATTYEEKKMFKIPGINHFKDDSFDNFKSGGINSFENCKLNGQINLAGVNNLENCKFLQEAKIVGTTKINGSTFSSEVDLIGTNTLKNSTFTSIKGEGSFDFVGIKADNISIKCKNESKILNIESSSIDKIFVDTDSNIDKIQVVLSKNSKVNKLFFSKHGGFYKFDKSSLVDQTQNAVFKED